MKKILSGGLMAAVLLFGATACGQEHDDQHGMGDAPVAGHQGDDKPKAVTNNPDGFGNVATGCVAGAAGWRYFVTTNTSNAPSNLVVLADKTCS